MWVWIENESDDNRENSERLTSDGLESYMQLIEQVREKDQELQQQADRLATMGRLVGGVAHEINNPLTFIKMNAELLARILDRHIEQESVAGIPDAQYKRPINAIHRGVERISDIVSGLIFFSRHDKREKTSVALAQCLEEAWVLVSSSHKELSHGVDLKVTIGPQVMIYGNAHQLGQVFSNLLHNALKAVHKVMPHQSSIIVNGYKEINEKEWVVIAVTDNGCGIAQSAIPRIFEPFYTSDDENGTGLGLSIVQGIVQEHGGKITVMSVVGQGATFTIRLPVWRMQEGDK